MSQPLRRRATYADIEELAPGLRGEILDGELYVSPRPFPPHAEASGELSFELKGAFQRGRGGPGGWWILEEPEVHLVEREPVVPDLAGWRKERLPTLPRKAHLTVTPDWICEVLSPSTESHDRGKKMAYYARFGVPYAWLVDPEARTLEVYVLDAGVLRQRGPAYRDVERVRAVPFDAIELDLSVLWA